MAPGFRGRYPLPPLTPGGRGGNGNRFPVDPEPEGILTRHHAGKGDAIEEILAPVPGHVAPGILSLGQIDRGQQADRLAGGLKPGIVGKAGPTGEGDHAGDGKIRLFLEEIVLRYPGLASEGECILDGDPLPIKAKGTAEGLSLIHICS